MKVGKDVYVTYIPVVYLTKRKGNQVGDLVLGYVLDGLMALIAKECFGMM